MKRVLALIGAVCMFLSANPAMFALAAEPMISAADEPSNVTITVVLPGPAETPEPTEEPGSASSESACIQVYPSDVTEVRENGSRQIVKIYELDAGESPNDIPRDGFERNGWQFSLTDIIRRETANAETREHTETITLNTDTKELEQILPLLSPTLEFTADDEFVGVLTLDVASIKIEMAGTKTSSYTMSVTREYPRLSAADTSLVPKTVTDKGKTYVLESVDWNTGNYVTVDYDTTPEYYTAIATYNATGTSTKVTGYMTTAEYTGTLAKLARGKTVYTAYFEGEEIRTPLEFAETSDSADSASASENAPAPGTSANIEVSSEPIANLTVVPVSDGGGNPNAALYVIISLFALMLSGAIYFIIRKGIFNNEKTHSHPSVAADFDGDDPGARG
jgi:hypothetical protein